MAEPATPRIGSPLLVPCDGSANAEAVLPFVPMLAGGQGEVILLHVVAEAKDLRGPRGEIVLSAEEWRRASEAAASAALDRAEAALASLSPDLRVTREIATGDPAEQIDEVAARAKASAILLSSQGASATGMGGFGSVVSRVVRTSPVPVMVVRPHAAPAGDGLIARFVVAHDGSQRAERMLPLVRDLARRLDAPVHVVTVVQDEEGPLPASVAARIAPHLRDVVHADAHNLAQRSVEAAGANLLRHGLAATWEVLAGPAAPTIIDVCKPRDVLVITSHGRGGTRWMLGSVAEKLIRECPAPVILLRTPPQDEDGLPA
jgi:nucleotide-binding universal stress UspA family protein